MAKRAASVETEITEEDLSAIATGMEIALGAMQEKFGYGQSDVAKRNKDRQYSALVDATNKVIDECDRLGIEWTMAREIPGVPYPGKFIKRRT